MDFCDSQSAEMLRSLTQPDCYYGGEVYACVVPVLHSPLFNYQLVWNVSTIKSVYVHCMLLLMGAGHISSCIKVYSGPEAYQLLCIYVFRVIWEFAQSADTPGAPPTV